MKLHEWHPLVADGSVRALKYSFGPATANTLAARLDDGSWLVVSPACRMPGSLLDELAKDGDVSALVAPNGFHHMGQAPWRARFPKAVSYAPEGALARLGKHSKAVPYRPLAELTAKLPPRLKLFVPAGMKSDDLLASIESPEGAVWFSGDLISNTVAEDLALFARVLFALLASGPGYRFNAVPGMVYLKDRAAWKADVRRAFERMPAGVVLPAHGNPVREDVAARTLALLA